ncbi:hypothetical protein ACFPOI_59785 [Nonomuraea angiospora]|uniref:Uncharacterized protein n=1 Tax=Nonomuraea angiospora TaxID=46172 RepID=A0ABR9LQ70_9ACTN|nr:hypothetical protein [Nonomuraea angiospora]MBE1582798.1 hypothetical protein [Nonomuraea angiospora]
MPERLPVPNEIREPARMIAPKVWVRRRIRRLAPRLVPRQASRACCRHHQVDWRQAAEAAIRLVRRAQAAGLYGERISDYAIERLDEQGLGDREQDTVLALARPRASRGAGPPERNAVQLQVATHVELE